MATVTAKVDIKVVDSVKGGPQFDLIKDINGNFTLEQLQKFVKGSLIGIAKGALQEEQDKGFDKNPTVIVDNKFNVKEEFVKPFGKIEYVAAADLKLIIREVYRTILRLSPVLSGRYFASNIVQFNERVVATTPQELESWLNSVPNFNQKDKIRFVNNQPYARKLERIGRTRKGKKKKTARRRRKKGGYRTVGVPNGAYAQAYNLSKRRFKKNVFFAFDILPGPRLGINNPDYKFKTGKKGQIGRPYLFPSIVIVPEFGNLIGVSNQGETLQ